LIFGFAAAIFLNVFWLLTSAASLVNTISAAYFIIFTQDNQNYQIIYPLALGWFLQNYIVYQLERSQKLAFVRVRKSQSHVADLQKVLDALPQLTVIASLDAK